MPEPPIGTITFLFTDIEGSTKLWERHPEAMSTALARHDTILHEAISQHGGYVFKTVGDAFCAAFFTAPEALEAALSVQQRLSANSSLIDGEIALKVRMALHTGAAEQRDGDYFGQPLNRIARLVDVGHGGQVLLSQTAFDLVRDVLPEGASLTALGQHRLKDLARPEAVFQLMHPSLPSAFPPLRSLDNPRLPNNLPQQVTSFIGRDKEIADISTLISNTRLLTLTGSGGTGKSRLSLQVAADLLDSYPDGVWFVEFAPLMAAGLVPYAVAEVLGVRETAGEPITKTLVAALQDKRLLLVLDNCEHVLDTTAHLVDALVRSCPNVSFLLSSREALGIAGESVYRVPSLALPDLQRPQTVESLAHCESVILFIERAVAARADFTVTNQNAPALVQVCHRLDGIPLAIELAAARVRSMTVEELASRLDNKFLLLTGGSRMALPRQQTLRALIDWSYDLLDETQKALLGRLSVFSGGWTLGAAEAVCSGGNVESWEVLDLLTTLTDKSLVVAKAAGTTTRYRLLETVRQYAREKLAAEPDVETYRASHRDYFLAMAEESKAKLQGPEQAQRLAALEVEHDNLRQAITFCLEESAPDQKGLQLGTSLIAFWERRGHLSEGRKQLELLLSRPQALDHAALRAWALSGAGVMSYRQGDFASAQSLYEESRVIYKELGSKRGIAICLNNLGILAQEQGDYTAARSRLRESLEIQRELEDRGGIGNSLNNLGTIAEHEGDFASARSLYEESLAIRRALEDKQGEATSLNNLGNVAYKLADYVSARSVYKESLEIHRELGDKHGLADSLNNLGSVALELGDSGSASALLEESLAIRRDIGDKHGIAFALSNLGLIANDQGDYRSARLRHQESLALRRKLGDKRGIALSFEAFASLGANEGKWAFAARLWAAAEALRETIGSPLPPNEREKYDREVAAARKAAGAAVFASALEEGGAMTMEQAIDHALENA